MRLIRAANDGAHLTWTNEVLGGGYPRSAHLTAEGWRVYVSRSGEHRFAVGEE